MLPSLIKRSILAGIAAAPLAAATLLPAVDESVRVALPNSVHPRVASLVPGSRVPAGQPMDRMLLVLRMGDAAKADLARLLRDQQDPASPSYHRWLTPAQFGQRFGAAPTQLAQAAAWLSGHGLSVDGVAKGGLALTFSGTAGQVEQTFRTALMDYQVDGVTHHANATSLSVPKELAGFVAGPASLNDFRHRPLYLRKARPAAPQATDGSGAHTLGAMDMATIYGLTDIYPTATGAGVTVAVMERTDPNTADFARFEGYQAPSRYTGSITVQDNGLAPGLLDEAERAEAELDAEWALAAAPGANVLLVASASSYTTDGITLSALYAVDSDKAQVLSLSFLGCEAEMGAQNLLFEQLWAQAAAQGQSVFVASGDFGADGCDTVSLGVNGLASPPYCTAVGGTEFNEGSGTYWGAVAGATGTYPQTALGYIPEVAWNEVGVGATGGGVSTLYAKPTWQAGTGVPGNGMRDLPDVALNAGAEHDPYMFALDGGDWWVGGTSVGTPIWAGLMALVVQRNGRQGNVNPDLYPLNSPLDTVFHDITSGTNSFGGVGGASAGTGYDECTGLGSPFAYMVFNHWPGSAGTDPITVNPLAITIGGAPVTPTGNTLTIPSGTTVSFAGSASSTGPGALGYTWNFGDGTLSPGADGSHTYRNDSGSAVSFEATFTASDGSTSESRTVLVTVQPGAVTAAITEPCTNPGVLLGIPIAFKGSASSNATSFSWNFGDGGTAATLDASHAYSTAGSYTVTFTATGGAGSASASLQVAANDSSVMDTAGNGTVDVRDLLQMAGAYGTGPATATSLNGLVVWDDLNADGVVDDTDLDDWITEFDALEQ